MVPHRPRIFRALPHAKDASRETQAETKEGEVVTKADKLPAPVKKMIARVQKKKELTEPDAIAYMLGIATGRLAALWRYGTSLPEGKATKGVMVAGRRKRAERTKPIRIPPPAQTAE